MNKLFFHANCMLYLGTSFDTAIHAHHTVQICIGLDKSLEIISDDGLSISSQVIVIPSNTPHKLKTKNTFIASLFIDVQSQLYGQLNLKNNGDSDRVDVQPFALSATTILSLQNIFKTENKPDDVTHAIEQLFGELSDHKELASPIDKRISQVLLQLNSHLSSQIPMEELACGVNLSTSRLAHLFKAHVGIPIRRYSLWRRVRYAVEVAVKHQSLTEGAHSAGFSDSAHFSRIVKQMYGIAPSTLLKTDASLKLMFL